MKKYFITLLILVAMNTWLYSEDFRIGGIISVESLDKNYDEMIIKFQDQSNLFPGFYWEVMSSHFSFGMTYQAKFDKKVSELPMISNEWLLTWLGSFDFRYHLFKRFFIDPYAVFKFGNAGSIELTDYSYYGYYNHLAQPLQLSLFAQVGVGTAVRLEGIHVGAELDYRFYNSAIPVTNFDPYPLKNFQFSLFGGFSL